MTGLLASERKLRASDLLQDEFTRTTVVLGKQILRFRIEHLVRCQIQLHLQITAAKRW